MSQTFCVNEQMVPYKGRSSLKQYIPCKPYKYGYKMFLLCDTSGILYNFKVYGGKIFPAEREPDLGASSNIFLQLTKCIPVGMNHLTYFDNWFTSLHLITTQVKKNIYALGTVRQCRLPNIAFPPDEELVKKGRG